ncbi:MAG: Oxidoreductase, 2Fe-2S and FAD/NAD(P) binding domain protein [Microgenomates group bacterium GW2011_GWC1_37_8]|uniref:Oxidoreductase, 2Fe-2S and FAD/NAD(P) binding domain protein n=1 Tax=Candidatus Woesebacteria bacterium GW2011_GWB1_38_8 TaxID=1618570 RepID=A0A0G0NIQ2_9BACT|nr:MAG: Oxidoreductase, 2Fe-2S and FAD/NAD(P) binding domain protein [Microgenomates group bacterium GW2011_GWC1_37_8]KKQ85774.1 MAG: Oxidoreductase, 2Fe-2S and FAD/NAD(P) binding domain protein [Candidatus Woesebacteria bacterium GW2011_GWB1_38_8]
MKLRLVKKTDEAKGTKSFFWEPEKKINYLPGQYFYFTLPKMTREDPKGNTRHFTLSSSPTEGNLIRHTTRIRESGYKKSLDDLKIGSEILGEGPNGTFILDENEKGPHVLLAGGIGITPFRSFIKYNIDKGLKDIRIHLIYSNSIPEEIAFRKELEDWDKENENINMSMTISKPEESKEKWSGLTGRIDEKMITRLTSHFSSPTYWLCGPPAMVDTLEKVLGLLKITSDKVRSEKFDGY